MAQNGAALTEDIVLERARAMVPELRERATRTEGLRRMPPETVAAFRDAGFYRILQPARFGGAELDYGAHTEMAMELARGCASSAWDACITACHSWIVGMFPPEAQHEVWDDTPEALISTSFMPVGTDVEKVAGGLRIGGRWKFSSGVDHCDWTVLALPGPPVANGPSDMMFALVRLADCTIEDTWHASGLAGTGSNDIVVDDLFVPDHAAIRVQPLQGAPSPGSALNASYLYRLPMFGVFSYNLVGAAIGAARGAAELVVEDLKTHVPITGVRLSQSQSVQLRVAESLAEIDAAVALVRKNRDEIVRQGRAGETPALEQRARYRRDNGFATLMCVRAVDRLYPLRGGRGLATDDPVQRAWRDIHAISHHIALTWDVQGQQHGAVILGEPCPDPRT